MMHQNNKLAGLLVLLFFFVVLGYAYFEGRNLIQGPEIYIDSPVEVFTSTEQKVAIQGNVARIVELRISGRPVPVTESGAFYEEVLLAPGYNRISLVARDKAEREIVKDLQIVYTPESTSSPPTPKGVDQGILQEED